jgi:hypothetical protein
VTVLSPFGTESFIDSEQTDGQVQAQNIVINNDLIHMMIHSMMLYISTCTMKRT